ncbi:hypothetical protein VPH35_126008 [Triticum aestivum]
MRRGAAAASASSQCVQQAEDAARAAVKTTVAASGAAHTSSNGKRISCRTPSLANNLRNLAEAIHMQIEFRHSSMNSYRCLLCSCFQALTGWCCCRHLFFIVGAFFF